MLIDLHAHTSGISKCCRQPASKILEAAREAGIDGIVLTNHYQKNYIINDDVSDLVERYMEEIRFTQKLGEQMEIKVFWGIEVTMELYPSVHMLVYGVDTDFLEKHPLIFDYTHEMLYKAVKDGGGALIQAHPFRNGTTVMNTNFLDGIEVNCHPLYKNSFSEEIFKIAHENGLSVTCGGDFHADTYRPICGTHFPCNISNGFEIGKYLIDSNKFDLRIHEPNSNTYKDVTYVR